MKAVSFIPTGMFSNAEIRAMWSLPVPDAIDSATSSSDDKNGFIFSCISFFKSNRELDVLMFIVLHFEFEKDEGVALSFTKMTCSHSILLMSAVICPSELVSVPTNATSFIFFIERLDL